MRHLDPPTDYDLYDRYMSDKEERTIATTTVEVETDFRLITIPKTKFLIDAKVSVTRFGNSQPEADIDLNAIYVENSIEEEILIKIDTYAFEKHNKLAFQELLKLVEDYAVKKAKGYQLDQWKYSGGYMKLILALSLLALCGCAGFGQGLARGMQSMGQSMQQQNSYQGYSQTCSYQTYTPGITHMNCY